ncbi:hypothetical protein LPB140_01480 [Sphingorhabdus lutea]|uniref:Uncharacterized protein n=1 Tax=Sphingorhabdus lutea TaxID=1913578 RepID=A0A1L3J9C6_9SPHN|nr:tetratricopeptide repeat protein [Sphingorhabdus lutea]APG61720.1 hypothetical protein LPB140_01480 [Sphingorhabdus lutea]
MNLVRRISLTFLAAASLYGCGAQTDSFNKAQSYFNAGQYASANVELLNAVKQNPDNKDVQILRAKLMIELGDGYAAESAALSARNLGGDPAVISTLLAEAALIQGNVRKSREQVDAAKGAFAMPADEYRLRGELALINKEQDEARSLFQKALEIDPKDAKTLINLGNIYLSAGEIIPAYKTALLAIEAAPQKIGGHILAGRAALQAQQYDRTILHLEDAKKLDANNSLAAFTRAAAFERLGRYDEMAENVALGRKTAPNSPYGQYLDGILEAQKGNYRSAVNLLEAANAQLPGDAVILAWLAESHFNLGNKWQAITAAEKANKLVPNDDYYRKLLDKVKA